MGGLQDCFRGSGRRKKHGSKVLVDSFGRETGAGFLPFDDLGVDGLETVILQALGRRAGRRDSYCDEETQDRSHDSILPAGRSMAVVVRRSY